MNTARKVLTEETDSKWIKCRAGWIRYSRMAGNRFHISATGHSQHSVTADYLQQYLALLINELGGRVR